ncbi:hypothetical protein NPIL_357171 [Nephila pilipes]|uniref:Uncharacterized protein n=1 Tax=Nephila pilipes TaxID=299642 RepID=A0A8X6MC99_NEPPI|nr:hypothetical protein NPIL_357171 [Nephila pilipes]
MVNVPTAGKYGIQNKAPILRVPVHQKRQAIHEKFWLKNYEKKFEEKQQEVQREQKERQRQKEERLREEEKQGEQKERQRQKEERLREEERQGEQEERQKEWTMEYKLEKLRAEQLGKLYLDSSVGEEPEKRCTTYHELAKMIPKVDPKNEDISLYLSLFKRQEKMIDVDTGDCVSM